MNDIICPHCKKVFRVDEAGFADILKQVRDHVFDKELHERLEIAEKATLIKEVQAYQERRNKAKATIKWQFTRAMAKEKFNLH